jgi:4-hydroxybenzoate polyprenyltransferase
MINKILGTIRDEGFTISSWIYAFIGILFVRFALESISSPSSSGIIPSDPYTLVHYGLYFLAVTLGTIYIFGHFIDDYKYSSKLVLFGLPLIWLAPILDVFISGGNGYRMSYIFDNGYNLFIDFITFFGPALNKGATMGIRIGIAISFIGLGYLIWHYTKKISKTILGIFLIYFFVFILATLPGFIYTVSSNNYTPVESSEITSFFEKNILRSTISHNTLREGFLSVSTTRFLELSFDKLMSQILFIISILVSMGLFWKINKEKFIATVKNARPERINFYTASLFCGIAYAYINLAGNMPVVIDIFGVICLFVAWTALWMHAVHLNDIYDLEIDKISNKERPLVNNSLTSGEMTDIGKVWLGIGLIGGWCAGFYPFFMALVYVACSYVYSVPPLRLRRLPLVPSFLIGVACLSTILAGYFFISTNKEVQSFPIFLSIGIVVMVTLAINFKDVKDVEGDKANGIMTIPNLFPRYGVQIVAGLFAISILLVPFFLSFYLLYIISVPCAIVGYRLITRKPYVEKYIFTLRFFFLFAIGLAYIFALWFSGVYNLI